MELNRNLEKFMEFDPSRNVATGLSQFRLSGASTRLRVLQESALSFAEFLPHLILQWHPYFFSSLAASPRASDAFSMQSQL